MATGYDPLRDNEPELARTMVASVKQRIACGERAGQHVRRMGSGCDDAGERPALTGPRCASVHGFSLHANTQVPAHRRDQLERLIRYTARGALSLERLAQDANGDLVYTFTKASVKPRRSRRGYKEVGAQRANSLLTQRVNSPRQRLMFDALRHSNES